MAAGFRKFFLPSVLLLVVMGFSCQKNSSQAPVSASPDPAWARASAEPKGYLEAGVAGDTLLARLYSERKWQWLLFEPPRLSPYGEIVLTTCENRFFDGMAPDGALDSLLVLWARAESLRILAFAPDSAVSAQGDINLYRQYYNLVGQVEVGLVHSWQKWALDMGTPPAELPALTARFFADPQSATMELVPDAREYRVIRAGLAIYEYLPDWKKLSFTLKQGEKIEPGDSGAMVVEIQERLAAEGFYAGEATGVMDSATVAALKEFQHYHYLEEDGVVGQSTIAVMNVPRETLVERLSRGVLYWRTTPLLESVRKDGWVFRVNIPEFALYVYRDGKLFSKNKVCVGSTSADTNFTPTVHDTVEFIVINPKWNVPDRIFEDEILEDMYDAGDALGYLDKKKFDVAVNKKGGITLVREPGDANALGRVKFLFPNRYNIYLHDTPTKSAFTKKARSVSHGCIRLEGAIDLARTILVTNEGWTEKGFQAAMNSGTKTGGRWVPREVWVPLKHKIPIYVDYVLTAADERVDRVVFFSDIYRGYGGKRRTY